MTLSTESATSPSRPLQRFVSYRILRAHYALNAQAMALLDRHAGITLSQWRVLTFVGSGDARTSRAVVSMSGLDPAIVSRAVKSLEDRGLMNVERLPEDRRTLALALTPAGQEIFARTLPVMQARQEALMDALDPGEREMILGALEKIELAADRRDF